MPTQVTTITQVFPAGWRVDIGKMAMQREDGTVAEIDVRILVLVDPETENSFVFPMEVESAEKLAAGLMGAGQVDVAPASALSALDRVMGKRGRDQAAVAEGRRR